MKSLTGKNIIKIIDQGIYNDFNYITEDLKIKKKQEKGIDLVVEIDKSNKNRLKLRFSEQVIDENGRLELKDVTENIEKELIADGYMSPPSKEDLLREEISKKYGLSL